MNSVGELQQTPQDGEGPASPVSIWVRMKPVPFVIFTLFLIFFLYQVVGGIFTFLTLGGLVTEENVESVRWMTLGTQVIFILVPTIILGRLRYPGRARPFRIKMPHPGELFATVVGLVALQQVLQGYMLLQESIPLPDQVERFIEPFRVMLEEMYTLLVMAHSVPELVVVTVVIAVVPAFSEEFLFRGLIQRDLEGVSGGFMAAIFTGIVFAAYHMNPFTFLPLAVLGGYFGYVVYRTGNLTLAITAHFLNNFLACLALYAGMEEDFVLLDLWSVSSASMLLFNSFVFLLVFTLSVLYLVRITAQRFQRTRQELM